LQLEPYPRDELRIVLAHFVHLIKAYSGTAPTRLRRLETQEGFLGLPHFLFLLGTNVLQLLVHFARLGLVVHVDVQVGGGGLPGFSYVVGTLYRFDTGIARAVNRW